MQFLKAIKYLRRRFNVLKLFSIFLKGNLIVFDLNKLFLTNTKKKTVSNKIRITCIIRPINYAYVFAIFVFLFIWLAW